ncbi:MAG: MATE family efflux transporter [Candidatus Avispirillum sp.]
MLNGSVAGGILRFSLPIMLSGMLQLLFNAADTVVVGRYGSSASLAAVGSTGVLINLIITLFMDLSVGTGVVTAHCYGAGDRDGVQKVVHTSMLAAAAAGVAVCFIGIGAASPALRLMGTPADVIDKACLYMQIYFLGVPAMMIYNFGAAILRSAGDTKRPLYFLTVSGAVNVLLNLLFVIVMKLDVAGVAAATVISQTLAAAMITVCMARSNEWYRLELRKLRIYSDKLKKIVRIGIPAGMQGIVFSASNVIVQSSINSFGSLAMSGSSAAASLEGFMFLAIKAYHQSCLSFIGQNTGAGKFDRVDKTVKSGLSMAVATAVVISGVFYLFRNFLLHLYIPNSEAAVAFGKERMLVICAGYFLCAATDVMAGVLRGMGAAVVPMLISCFGVCGTRILWVMFVFPHYRSFTALFISYPVSWLISFAAQIICYTVDRRIAERRLISPQNGV